MRSTLPNSIKALGIVILGVGIAIAAILVGEADDAPGASVAGIVLLIGSVVLAVRVARRRG